MMTLPAVAARQQPANRFRPLAITLSTEALSTIRRILTRHLNLYDGVNSSGLRLPFRADELEELTECLPYEGGNVLLTRPTLTLLGHYALYLTKETERGSIYTVLPNDSALTVCRHIRLLLYATISPTHITFQL